MATIADADHEGPRKLQSERYLQALIDHFPFLLWLKDTESRYLAVNQPLADALGEASVAAFVGRNDFDYSPRDLAARYVADDAEVQATGEIKHVVEQVVTHGIRQWFETYKAPVYDDLGALLGTVGFARDISDRKREEEAIIIRNAAQTGLLRGEALRGVLELIVLSVETELSGCMCLVFLADKSETALTLDASPSLRENWIEGLHTLPIDAEGASCVGRAAARRQNVLVEDVRTAEGEAAFHALSEGAGVAALIAVPMLSPDGRLLGVFAAGLRQAGAPGDRATAILLQASQLLALILVQQRNNEQVQETLATFRRLFDSVDQALFVQRADGVFLDVNLAAARMFARRAEELVGLSQEDLAATGLNDLPAVAACIREAAAGKPVRLEFWAKDAQGRAFPCEVNLQPSLHFGEPVVMASVQDVSDKKAAALRLQIEHDLATALASGVSREALYRTFLDIALQLPEFDCGGVYELQPDESYVLAAHRGLSEDFVGKVRHCPAGSPQAAVVRQGQVLCTCANPIESCTHRGLIHQAHLQEEGLLCLVVLPVHVEGQPLVSLNLSSHRARHPTKETFSVLESLRQHFSQTLLRMAAQEEAARLQHNLSGLFDTLEDFLFVLDREGKILHYNRAVTALLGYNETELRGLPVVTVHPENCREMAQRVMADMLAGRRNNCPLPLLRRDGSSVMVETRVVAGYWNRAPALFGISQDISERLLSEERQKLAASVFENAHEGIMITDPAGVIVAVNPTFTELTGYAREEAVGQNAGLLKSGHHDAAFYREMWLTISDQGYWRGEVWNRKKSGEIFVELLTLSTVRDHRGQISHFVGIFSDITLLKEHQERLERLAHFDALTQLPNRMLFADRLQLAMAQTERSRKLLAISYLDLDGFKPVNDTFGHAMGDRLLVEVAQRLKQCIRAGDTVARLGGDEFVLLFAGLDDLQECNRAVSRVLSTLALPFTLSGQAIQISASVGVTLYPEDGSDADTLLRHADQAMYAAKQSGRNRFHLFDPETDRRARLWREEVSRVREALEKDEFVLYYQPKVNMREGQVVGAEALIRWRHPERGLLLPGAFLPAIEEGELCIAVGEWVIETALRQMSAWLASGRQLPVSVNIAGAHLLSVGFVDRLAALLSAHPELPRDMLELEILETAALEDMAHAAQIFTACRQLGVNLALDDFGTGYSSLTYFRRLPADVLKIDQSFVRDMIDVPDDLSIVEGIIGLTQAFHRKVIAEGVETPEHGMLLLQMGCDVAQGFGIARPMPPEELEIWANTYTPDPIWSSVAGFHWAREDLPMLLAEVDHLRWVDSVNRMLDEPADADMVPLSHRDCRFGRWYYGIGHERYGAVEGYADIEEIHAHLHTLGNRLIGSELPETERSLLRQDFNWVSARLSHAVEAMQTEVLMRQGNY